MYCSSDRTEHRLRLSEVDEIGSKTPGRPGAIAEGIQYIRVYLLHRLLLVMFYHVLVTSTVHPALFLEALRKKIVMSSLVSIGRRNRNYMLNSGDNTDPGA